ncbi:kinesin-like protein [Talaromyces proteolyticus]|uniref:Kinesin-like protein n=1 Tax=Talaromyces proteolyticus TaxID=1131652 RepID=A0AAD4L0K6_9EURO|nr:kinesin-like protein [Talaromyces proteolyticus]KAH8705363.1 kinesin-like protein [Talaromyces proteolyticus]
MILFVALRFASIALSTFLIKSINKHINFFLRGICAFVRRFPLSLAISPTLRAGSPVSGTPGNRFTFLHRTESELSQFKLKSQPNLLFMYINHISRQRDLIAQFVQLLRGKSREMALDVRLYNHLGPITHSSAASVSSASGFTSSTAATSVSMASAPAMQSTASSPSLRSRESVIVSTGVPSGIQSPGGGGNVKVVVRVRGFLPRETQKGSECLISMNPFTQATTLRGPESDTTKPRSQIRGKVYEDKTFTFDRSFWSHNQSDEQYADQEDVYNCLGEEFLDHNFEGYHTCIFAYGQTGSGKSYTMMGTPERPGLIPRTCEDLFQRIDEAQSVDTTYNVRVSYFEVYNEHVRDLLVPRTEPPHYLKIRESPTDGPYVKDLTDVPVRSFADVMNWMRKGDMSRTVASTKMNDTSSRSHAVFTIVLKQIHHDLASDETTERTARIRLVDLAGSERAKATEATGQRLREGSNINKSLTTLGRVIAALADPKMQRPGRRAKEVVPYRDSILTWLLKDSLGGNSKTAMIACIAPSDYDETLSTLRYADQAKRIRTRAVVNQDHVSAAERDAQISEMTEQIRVLQLAVSQNSATKRESEVQNEKLEEYQQQVEKMQRLMEENKMVSECKIRQLQTENEALRNHLKLALDSLKNPIPDIPLRKRETSLGSLRTEETEETQSNERDLKTPPPPEEEEENSGIWEDDDQDSAGEQDDVAWEMQADMENLLEELTLFRRKLTADHERFGIARVKEDTERRPFGRLSVNSTFQRS